MNSAADDTDSSIGERTLRRQRWELAITQAIEKDIIAAMKAHEEHRLTTLRMVKSALKNKAIEKREPLTDAEEAQTLTTLVKQRRESVALLPQGRPA